jgi:hypothetical protein
MLKGPYSYADAPRDFIDRIAELEKRSDCCYERLALLSRRSSLAAWGVLTGSLIDLDATTDALGQKSVEFHAQIINVDQDANLLLRWVRDHAVQKPTARRNFRWNASLAAQVANASKVAHDYMSFKSHFPMWYKGYGTAELVGDSTIRFSLLEGNERRVAAFQKGLHQGVIRAMQDSLDPPRAGPILIDLCRRCKGEGPRRFSSPDAMRAFHEIYPTCLERIALKSRRGDSLALGSYTLGDHRQFLAALASIVWVHDYTCFAWERRTGRYPVDSGVLIEQPQRWIEMITDLSGMSSAKAESIVRSMTLPENSRGVLLYPFIPLDAESRLLGVVPQFVLRSNPEDNILRVCSYTNAPAYSEISNMKETEMFEDLVKVTPQRYNPRRSVGFAFTDLDLVLEDAGCSTVILAELKWVRKPLGMERQDRDRELMKGVKQIKQIEAFLKENPSYLSDRKVISAPLDTYERVQFLVVARDHLKWGDAENECPIVEYETFKEAVRVGPDLRTALTTLLSYDWLPEEGRDFAVQYERFCVEGVCIEAPVFYPYGKSTQPGRG